MKKLIIVLLVTAYSVAESQPKLSLDSICGLIVANNPALKNYDASARSLDEASKGARTWDAPLLSSGLWMTPYDPNLWKRQPDGATGMGQFMISAQQMFPNKRRQDAEEKYMSNMSSVEKERKDATLNELLAAAKQNYYEWIILKKKMDVLGENARLLDFMIRNAELRYKNNLGRISAYYKARASAGNIENLRIVLANDMEVKRITLNTLMSRDQNTGFDIDTIYAVKDYGALVFDSSTIISSRGDIRAIDRDIALTGLQQDVERSKLKPEFGIRYDHMFGFGGLPLQYSLMGMVRLPMAKWSSKASQANVESLKWKAESLNQQKLMIINESMGSASRIRNEFIAKRRQLRLYEENIIPALRKNFQSMQLGYEQNTEELFTLYDAWETLNMTQLDYLDQLQQLLMMQVEMERVLEIK